MAKADDEPTPAEIERAMRDCVGPDGEDLALRDWTAALTPEELRVSEENLRRAIEEGRRTLRRARG